MYLVASHGRRMVEYLFTFPVASIGNTEKLSRAIGMQRRNYEEVNCITVLEIFARKY